MIFIRLLIILLCGAWAFLPAVAALVGYMMFDKQVHEGLAMALLFGCCAYLVHSCVNKVQTHVFPAKANHGSARFARLHELSDRGLFKQRGVLLGRFKGRMIRYSGAGHLLTFAPTRSGKGVGCVIPNLLSWEGSVVVTDIKGENIAVSGAYRNNLGPVYALDPFGITSYAARYNPFSFIRAGTRYELDDARLLAEMLVVSESAEPNHWEREARTLLTGLILYLRRQCPLRFRNLAHLRNLLMEDQEGFEFVLQRMASCDHAAAARIARGFSQKEAKERSAVISTAQAATAVFDSPQLAEITSRSDFNLDDLKSMTMSLFVVVPPEQLAAYQPFTRLVAGLALAAMTRGGTDRSNQVLFLLDELPALGYMRPIEEGIGYLAGYGTKLWLFVQDLDQLERTYPKARSMIANCAVRQAFNVQDSGTAKLLSEILGIQTVRVSSMGHTSPLPLNLLPIAFHKGAFETARALLTPDEITTLPADKQLLFVEGLHGIVARKLRYFSWREWKLKRRSM